VLESIQESDFRGEFGVSEDFVVAAAISHCCAKFDVRIKDFDEVNFLDLVDEMIDEAMKQDVLLPRLWRMFYEYPSLLDSGRRVKVVDDRNLVSMFPEFIYEDEVKVFIEEAASVGKAMEEERKRVEEERKRIEEEEKIEREIEEAKKYTVAIEVPVVNVDPSRPAKTSSKREGTYVPKTKGGTRATTRGRKSIQPQEDPSEDDESPWGSDTSEDDDYVQSDVSDEEDLEDLDLVNEFGDEDDVDAPITSKSFEDCLDGSSCFNQLYNNGTVVGEMEFGEVKLEQWMIFSNKEHFPGTFRDFCIQEVLL
ncbi:Actin cytoskeleton-regulatory complex protein PAN1, partial [Bienertia sinuspersici]